LLPLACFDHIGEVTEMIAVLPGPLRSRCLALLPASAGEQLCCRLCRRAWLNQQTKCAEKEIR
jgi:hypothetical protein